MCNLHTATFGVSPLFSPPSLSQHNAQKTEDYLITPHLTQAPCLDLQNSSALAQHTIDVTLVPRNAFLVGMETVNTGDYKRSERLRTFIMTHTRTIN